MLIKNLTEALEEIEALGPEAEQIESMLDAAIGRLDAFLAEHDALSGTGSEFRQKRIARHCTANQEVEDCTFLAYDSKRGLHAITERRIWREYSGTSVLSTTHRLWKDLDRDQKWAAFMAIPNLFGRLSSQGNEQVERAKDILGAIDTLLVPASV